MIRRLTDTLHIVVAARTTAEDRVMVHFDQRKPFSGAVAVFTEIRAQDMVRRFRCCRRNAPTRYMATDALGRRALEHATNMTALAVGIQMRAIEAETGCQMIEIRIERRLRRSQTWQTQSNHSDEHNNAVHRSSFRSANDVVR